MKWREFKWVVENFGNILLMVLSILFILGTLVELIARLIPTKTPDSVLTRIGLKMGSFGSYLVSIGKNITKLLDFVRFPNRRR